MGFCGKCGKQLSVDQMFCTSCGKKVADSSIQTTKLHKEDIGYGQSRRKTFVVKRPTRKFILIFGLCIAVLTLISAGHVHMRIQTDPMRVIEKLDDMVQREDASALAEMMNAGQTDFNVTEEAATSYIIYLKEDKENYLSLLEDLKLQVHYSDEVKPIKDKNGIMMFKLEKKAQKKWFFYNQFEVIFYPVKLVVSSNLDGASIWINGIELEEKTEPNSFIEVGYIFPGEHFLRAEYKGAYSSFEREGYIDFSLSKNNLLEAMIGFESATVELSSNFDDAILFVNGKSTGKEIREVGTFGPVTTDGTISIHAERTNKGETIKTEPIPIYEDMAIRFELEEPSAINEVEMARFMDSYFSIMVNSINLRDISLAEFVLDLEGKSYPEHRDYLKVLEKRGITEEYLGMELVEYVEVDGGYRVKTNEKYNIFYGDGSSKYKSFVSEFFVRLHDSGLKVHSLLNTQETDSRDYNY